VLYLLSISSLGVYGVVLSGWSSNSKYSLLGGLRSSAQMVSYELPMGLAVIAAVMISTRNNASLSLASIVNAQNGGFWNWNAWNVPTFVIPGFVAFVVYMICGIAETNRAPFDLPEAETELVAGYHTEYSGMRFALFFMAEYINMIIVSSVATIVFLGGWWGPVGILPGPWWFLLKVVILLYVYVWLRATLPRMRYDRLMALGWKSLFPLSLAMMMITAVVVVAAQGKM
jgi:NADH-quinone oxidoreductase subunit H